MSLGAQYHSSADIFGLLLDTIFASGNIHFYSFQSTNANSEDNAIIIDEPGAYSSNMYLTGDLKEDFGRQIQIIVETKVPEDSAGGSYSTSYGIKTGVQIPD